MQFTDEIVEQYESMVADIAWRYTKDPTLHKDLMQEGYIGLYKACVGYDPERATFSTYAYRKIWAQMQQYINYKVSVVHIPIAQKESGKVYSVSIDRVSHECQAIGDDDLIDRKEIFKENLKVIHDYTLIDAEVLV